MKLTRVFVLLGCALSCCDPGPHPAKKEFKGPLICNFTQSHAFSDISSPGSQIDYGSIYQGEIAVTLKLPESKEFVGDAFLVTAKKGEDGNISMFHITTMAGTLNDMHQLARKIIKNWNLPEKDLQEWVGKVSADPNYAYLFETMDNKAMPSVTLSSHHSLVEDKPWCLFLESHWPSRR